MKSSNLNTFIDQYAKGELPELQVKKFEKYLEVRRLQKEKKMDIVVTDADEERLFKKFISNIDNLDEIENFRYGQSAFNRIIANPSFRIAAAIILLVTLSAIVWLTTKKEFTHEVIAQTNYEKVILPDGTLVLLQKAAVLNYNDEAARNVSLKGEAHFEVVKDPAHPFIIACGDVKVKVLGTSFDLKTTDANIELHVLTGKVNLSSLTDKKGVDVLPNEMVLYNSSGKLEKMTVDPSQLPVVQEYARYNMQFSDELMEEVIERLANKFSVTFKVENDKLLQCHVTADLTDLALNTALSRLTDILNMEYKVSGNTITLTGNGCK